MLMVSSQISVFGLETKKKSLWSAHSIKLNLIQLLFWFVAKAAVNPPLTENLRQLLTSEMSLESDGSLG